MKRLILAFFILLLSATEAYVADPIWTYQYDFTKTPAANNFTQTFTNSPATVTAVTTGNPANRRVQIDSTTGDAIFITSTIPSLDSVVGATAEFTINVSGDPNGDAGFELTFLDRAFGLNIFPNQILIDTATATVITVPTASNSSDLIWRVTYAAGFLNVFRSAILVAGPIAVPVTIKPFQRVLWWCEGGAICQIKSAKFFTGGGVAP